MKIKYTGTRANKRLGKNFRFVEIEYNIDKENDLAREITMLLIDEDEYGWNVDNVDGLIICRVGSKEEYESFKADYKEAKKRATGIVKWMNKHKEAIEAEEAEETKEEVKKIDGHDYTIETMNSKGTRKYYHFNDRNSKGEKIDIEFDKVENDYKEHMTNVWYKNGFIKERLKSYWHITVYATDQKGFTWGRYNPQILPGGTKINFNWILEATEENKERILHEIIKRAYNGKIENI